MYRLIFKISLFSVLFKIKDVTGMDQIEGWLAQRAITCGMEIHVPMADLLMLQNHKMPSNPDAKCLMACVYKKAKWINDEGMYDPESAKKIVKDQLKDNKKIEISNRLFDSCIKVNEQPVGDGQKDCERAAHLYNCLVQNRPIVMKQVESS